MFLLTSVGTEAGFPLGQNAAGSTRTPAWCCLMGTAIRRQRRVSRGVVLLWGFESPLPRWISRWHGWLLGNGYSWVQPRPLTLNGSLLSPL